MYKVKDRSAIDCITNDSNLELKKKKEYQYFEGVILMKHMRRQKPEHVTTRIVWANGDKGRQ